MAADLGYDGGLTCALGVKDLDAAIAWYGDVLGFQLKYKMDEVAWCEMSSPVERVNVGLSQVDRASVEGGATMTFGVKDIARSRSSLEEKGVRFDGETMTIPNMVSLATFYDPDGNKLMLYQDLANMH